MAIRRYGNKEAHCQGRYHKGRGFVVMGHWRFHTGIVQHSPLRNSNINTQTPQDRSKAPAPKAPQHHSQPSHPQASTSAKTQPSPPFPAPSTSHSSLHPPVNSPFPLPRAFPPSNSLSSPRPPATNPKASYRCILTSVPSKSGSQLIPSALETP